VAVAVATEVGVAAVSSSSSSNSSNTSSLYILRSLGQYRQYNAHFTAAATLYSHAVAAWPHSFMYLNGVNC
jgi:hypothetical protein